MSEQTLFGRLAENEEQRTAIRFAFYNTLFFVLVAICLAGLFALYQMMHLFLTPILWATLVGTVLFPLKRKISRTLVGWLKGLDEQNTPFLIGAALIPWNAVNKASSCVFDNMFNKTGLYYVAAYLILKVLSYGGTLVLLLSWMGRVYSFADSLLGCLTHKYIFVPFLLYTVLYATWIFIQDYDTIHQKKKFARSLSLPIWIVVLAHTTNYCGPFRVLVFAISALVLGLISAGLIGVRNGSNEKTEKSEENEEIIESEKPKVVTEERLDSAISSDTHLRIIGALCLLLWTARHDSMLVLIFVLFLIALFKDAGHRLGIFDSIREFVANTWLKIRDNVNKLVNIVVAGSLRQFVHILFTSDKYLISGLTHKVDLIASVAVMAILALGSVTAVVFVGVQLHSETVHLARLAGSVLSTDPDWLRTALNYTEGQLSEHDVDDYIEQAYQQSRVWLAANIRSLADPKDTQRADQLEIQAKALVDNLYRMWEERSAAFPTPDNNTTTVATRGDIFSQLMSASNLESLKSELTLIVTENIETVITIAHSLWALIVMNISLLSTVIWAVFGLLLGFGFDILNFFIEVIVFLTATYYLLAGSSDQWLPLRWIANIAPAGSAGTSLNVATAIETAISGVFVLSSKMAIFYGMYTYFVHAMFDLNIVFVPSIVAAVFAAIPIMPPYSVALFGAVELYVVRAEGAATLVFLLASVAPLLFADTAFYSEVKSSHPYVTGLAVIGGMYWIGLQGAVIGPIVLCCLLVLVNVYADFAKSR